MQNNQTDTVCMANTKLFSHQLSLGTPNILVADMLDCDILT